MPVLLLVIAVFSAVYRYHPAEASPGAAGSTRILMPAWTMDGVETGGEFAYATSSAGDVNNDGYDDILIGSPKYSVSPHLGGAAFLYLGGPGGPDSEPAWLFGGEERGDRFGASAAAAGDVNNDGFDDVLIGAYRFKALKSEEGKAYLFLGNKDGLESAPAWTYSLNYAGSQFGYAVNAAGDVNNDGFDDVIIGARWYTFGEANEGAAFVFYGTEGGLESSPRWMYESGQEGAAFGTAVTGAGDVNRDGYDDILVGAPQYTVSVYAEGAAMLFYGSEIGPSSTPDWISSSGHEGSKYGASVSAAGDINRDQFADIIVGAPEYYPDAIYLSGEGAAFVFFGAVDGLSQTPDWQQNGHQDSPQYGISTCAAGDINGDGYSDVIIGAYLLDDDQPDEGGVYIYLGSPIGLPETANFIAYGDKAEATLGFDVNAAGDVDNDGFDDLIAGAPWYRHSEAIVGRAFLYFGLPTPDLAWSYLFIPFIGTE